jgi:4-hydroxy-tetrahydrodipicolinate synthase
VALWDAVQRGDHARAHNLHRRLLRLWNALVGDNLPACVKHAQTVQNCPVGRPRAPMPRANADQRRAIEAALKSLENDAGGSVKVA